MGCGPEPTWLRLRSGCGPSSPTTPRSAGATSAAASASSTLAATRLPWTGPPSGCGATRSGW
eukprot:8228992-Alexandrium_andersonii.AAC.1